MILLSKPFTRSEIQDLLRDAALDALCAERPELRRLNGTIVHTEVVLPVTGTHKGGAIVEFTLAEPTHRDLPGRKTIFSENDLTPERRTVQP